MSQSSSRAAERDFKRSLSTRIGNLAKETKRSRDSIQFELVFQCFLHRVFTEATDATQWVLKGGTALLMRNGHGRFTQDIDLARVTNWENPDEIRREFEQIAQRKVHDPFTFSVTSVHTKSSPRPDGYATPTVEVKLEAKLGATVYHRIKIDVSVQRHTQAPMERVPIDPLLNQLTKDGGYDSFDIFATAIEAHLADKICAMYEIHHSGASNRFHDLADIIQIICTQNFSAAKLVNVLEHETRRRSITWPTKLVPPSPEWEKNYKQNAPSYGLPVELYPLEASLDFAGKCLDEVLQLQRIYGTWNYLRRIWED